MHSFINKNYEDALTEYKNGDDTSMLIELKILSRQELPEYDRDTMYFLGEATKIAEKNNNKNILTLLTQLSRKIDEIGGAGYAYSSVLEDNLETEHDCVVALHTCLQNGQYEYVLQQIIIFIRKSKNFHVALTILKELDKSNIVGQTFTKEDVIKYFTERMEDVISNDICVQKVLGGLWGYKSLNWGKGSFNNDDYVLYHDLVVKLNKGFKK